MVASRETYEQSSKSGRCVWRECACRAICVRPTAGQSLARRFPLTASCGFCRLRLLLRPVQAGHARARLCRGQKPVIEWRSAEGNNERLPGLAAELVNLKVDVIVTAGTPAISAAQKATTTIPIVMGNIGDPVGSGFVKSLARPASNITGLSSMAGDVYLKQIEML